MDKAYLRRVRSAAPASADRVDEAGCLVRAWRLLVRVLVVLRLQLVAWEDQFLRSQ